MKNSNDTIGNETRDIPACSAVPQPTAPPRALQMIQSYVNKWFIKQYAKRVGVTVRLRRAGADGNYENLSGRKVSRPRFETGTLWIQISGKSLTATLLKRFMSVVKGEERQGYT